MEPMCNELGRGSACSCTPGSLGGWAARIGPPGLRRVRLPLITPLGGTGTGRRGQLEGNGHPPVKFKRGPSFPPHPPGGSQSSRTSPWQPHSSQVIFINEGTPIAGEDKRVAERWGRCARTAPMLRPKFRPVRGDPPACSQHCVPNIAPTPLFSPHSGHRASSQCAPQP